MASSQRKLTALLHELQHARSPLAQARIVARSWRTLRELSSTDRRLLARNLGFEGAEEILEGLSRKGGLAPAMLLRVLGNARATDESAVAEILATFRDPDRRDEAVSLSAEFASDLLAEQETEDVRAEAGDAIEELRAGEDNTVKESGGPPFALEDDETQAANEVEMNTSEPVLEPETEQETAPQQVKESEPEPDIPPPQPPAAAEVVDWSRWERTAASPRQAPQPRPAAQPPPSQPDTGRSGVRAVMGTIQAERSTLSQLRVLRRELSRFEGSNLSTLSELVESFADGWVRRRAVCALLEGGIVVAVADALELVSALNRESDRRWCLGLLARRAELGGANLDRALELVSSPSSRRRLRIAARK